jgi:aminotransferase EvaB
MFVKLFDAEVVNALYDLERSMKRVIDSHHYVLGNEVSSLEKKFAEYNNSKYCVSLANGTDALELAMRAVGIAHGDKVAMVANAGFYGSTAAYRIGAVPVYVDIDDDLTMSFESFKEAVKFDVKAVIITHLYGKISSQLEEILDFARENDIYVIEDCAQAHGAVLNNKKAGTFGDIGCFSFYPTKNLGAIGDGGAIISDKEDVYERVKTLRQYGWSKKILCGFSLFL